MLETVEVLAILILCYVLPIVHVVRSPRTPPGMRVFYVIAVIALGPVGYALWSLMSGSKTSAQDVTARIEAGGAVAQGGKTALVLTRTAFYGLLVNYKVYVDDRTMPVAQIRGRRTLTLQIDPGPHTLYVKLGRWLEYPFEAKEGDVLVFSLNAEAKDAFTTGVEGWIAAANGGAEGYAPGQSS
jgi:hypothetical protein